MIQRHLLYFSVSALALARIVALGSHAHDFIHIDTATAGKETRAPGCLSNRSRILRKRRKFGRNRGKSGRKRSELFEIAVLFEMASGGSHATFVPKRPQIPSKPPIGMAQICSTSCNFCRGVASAGRTRPDFAETTLNLVEAMPTLAQARPHEIEKNGADRNEPERSDDRVGM